MEQMLMIFPMAFFHHPRKNSFGNDKRRVEVNVNDLAELLGFHLCHRNPFDDAGIVDQNIDRSEFLFNIRNHLCNLGFVRYITKIALRLNALCLIVSECFFHMFFASAVKCNFGSCLRISLSDRKADTVCRSCDKSNFSL